MRPVSAVAVALIAALAAGPAVAQMSFDFQSPSFGGNNVAKRQQQMEAAKRTNPYKDDSDSQSATERLNESIRSRAEREIASQIINDDAPLGGLDEFETRTEDGKGFVEIPGADGSTIEIEVPTDTKFWKCLSDQTPNDDCGGSN